MASEQPLYRVIFMQEDEIYEVYARYLSEEGLIGFIELDELVFSDGQSLVVDPSEEKLRHEFRDVKRTYVPLHQLLRIDEVVREGSPKIKGVDKKGNVHHLINYRKPQKTKK